MSGPSIQQLHKDGSTEYLIDLIFVHGLGGDAIDTWHPKDHAQDLWPRWLAEDHPEVAVWTIGYPARATKWAGGGSGMSLPDRGKQILDYLAASGFGRLPIVFVAHSLGGLLVKQILRSSVGLGVPQYSAIGKMTRGVNFLATPHTGSDLSGLADGLSLIFRPTDEVEDLRASNPYLIDLADWYRNQAPNLGISTHAYRENRKLADKFWVVEPASADPGIAGALCIPQDEDHFTIAKPTDRQHHIYIGVRSMLSTLIQVERKHHKLTVELSEDSEEAGVVISATPQPPMEPSQSSTANNHDNQLFQDLKRGFQFKLPQSKGWSQPQWMMQEDYLTRLGFSQEHINEAKRESSLIPMGKMIAEGECLYLFYGAPIIARYTDDTTTKQLEVYLQRLKDFRKERGEPLDENEIQKLKQVFMPQHIKTNSYSIQNLFMINTMRKELAASSPVTPSLPHLFMMITQSMQSPIDDIVANDQSILWGSTVTLRNVDVAGEIREFTANTMTLLTEGKDFFYQVAVYYSPQTENSMVVWNQLQEMMQSFIVLDEKL